MGSGVDQIEDKHIDKDCVDGKFSFEPKKE
jgi:hypothetical protein